MSERSLGVIGCGNIGSVIVKTASSDLKGKVGTINVWDTDVSRTDSLVRDMENVYQSESLEEVFDKSDLIVEAVSPQIAGIVMDMALVKGKDVLIMSIGGLLGKEEALSSADERGIKILLPSGALAGIDAVKAAKIAGIEKVTITTKKPPASIKGASYFEERGIDVDAIDKETVVFEGTAKEAIQAFPKNINVSVLLSLAGIGPEKTKVRIMVSPDFTQNQHEVEVVSSAGTVFSRTSNVPSPTNPKTSYMAVLSAIVSLKSYFSSVRIGS